MESHSIFRIRIAIGILIFIVILGVTGYMILEGISFMDALYMTVITISTVGFSEVRQLSDAGRVFTIILIVTSFGTYAYAISLVTTYFVEGQLSSIIKGNKIKTLKKMSKHVIICGFGRNGQQAAKELEAYHERFVVIDMNPENLSRSNSKNYRFIEGNATEDEILLKADIKKARSLITTLPNDADNLYVIITARALNPDLILISRASDENTEKKLRMAGVDNVVMPEKVGGAHMAKLVARPDVLEFLDKLSVLGDAPTNLEEITCDNLPKNMINKSISDTQIRKLTGANIVGFKTPQGEYIVNPLPDTIIREGSKLFVLGTPDQIERMNIEFRE